MVHLKPCLKHNKSSLIGLLITVKLQSLILLKFDCSWLFCSMLFIFVLSNITIIVNILIKFTVYSALG